MMRIPVHQQNETVFNATALKLCLTAQAMLETFGYDGETLPVENLTHVCPVLAAKNLLPVFMKDCSFYARAPENGEEDDSVYVEHRITFSESIGYGTLSVGIISLLPVGIFFIIPKPSHPKYHYVMISIIALATSSLLTDTALHLIPKALNIKKQKHRGPNDYADISDALQKCLVLLGPIYCLYLFEMLVSTRESINNPDEATHQPEHQGNSPSHRQGKSHGNRKLSRVIQSNMRLYELGGGLSLQVMASAASSSKFPQSSSYDEGNEIGGLQFKHLPPNLGGSVMNCVEEESMPENAPDLEATGDPATPQEVSQHLKSGSELGPNGKSENDTITVPALLAAIKGVVIECLPKKPFGWVILLTDAIHNVMDGLAIGAAFSTSALSGISTSLAVVFHEIPHEIGDFAALLTSGVTWRGAMIWHGVQTVIAFIGLYAGLGVSTDDDERKWVYALISGVFLHHALSEFLPELIHIQKDFWTYFILQQIGIVVGFVVVFIITVFEEALHYSFLHKST